MVCPSALHSAAMNQFGNPIWDRHLGPPNTTTLDLDASYSSPSDGLAASGTLNIGAYTCVILSHGDPPPAGNPADVDGSGTVDAVDVNDSGTVDASDLALVLGAWGWQG